MSSTTEGPHIKNGFFIPTSNPDDDTTGNDPDDDVIISIIPSIPTIHGSDEDIFTLADPFINDDTGTYPPYNPSTTDYVDYISDIIFDDDFTGQGDVVLVLDEDTYSDWIANGAQGSGYTITPEKEIKISSAEGFYLGGLPASAKDNVRFIEIKYNAVTNFKPVAFDLRMKRQSDNNVLDMIHVEVWNPENRSSPRSSTKQNDNYDNLVLSPNPSSDGIITVTLEENSEMQSISIFDMQGKLQLQQSAEGNTTMLNIETIKKGLYIVKVTDTEGRVHTKKGMKL